MSRIAQQSRSEIIPTSVEESIPVQRAERVQESILNPVTITRENISTITTTRQGQIPMQQTITRIQSAPASVPYNAPATPFNIGTAQKTPPAPITPFKRKPGLVEGKRAGFTARVRRRGKFAPVGVFETVGAAFGKGRRVVEETAAASFDVISSESGKRVSLGSLPGTFTPAKREYGVAVQKRQFRISSAGEKMEISAKGRFIARNKPRGGFKL